MPSDARRIRQVPVPPLFPTRGPIRVMLVGEAPGPRGADQSGVPFWGDRAGKIVYETLASAGLASIPPEAWSHWDGRALRELGLKPIVHGVVLGNAYPCCPSADLRTFRAPTDKELRSEENLARLQSDLRRASDLCPARLKVIALGRRAQWIFDRLPDPPDFSLHTLPHPSAQGLLQSAPGRGKGLRLADLEQGWKDRLTKLLAP